MGRILKIKIALTAISNKTENFHVAIVEVLKFYYFVRTEIFGVQALKKLCCLIRSAQTLSYLDIH